MKYITLATVLLLISAQDVKCPSNSKENTTCIEIYSPVCGYTSQNEVTGTFSNSCFACIDAKVNFYRSGECEQTGTTTTNTPDSQSTSTTNQNDQTSSSVTLKKCSEPRAQGDSVICPANYINTCGLFKSTIQCIKAPCGKQYGNDCEACADSQVDSYFYGNCEDQQSKQEEGPTSSVIECQEPRPEMCVLIYTETCAFTTSPCFDSKCMVQASSGCNACSNSINKAYYQGSCESYTQTLISDSKSNQDSTSTVNTECPTTTPLACDDNESLVCGISSTESKEKQFINSCKACTDKSIKSYYQGKCKSLSKFDLLFTVSIIVASMF